MLSHPFTANCKLFFFGYTFPLPDMYMCGDCGCMVYTLAMFSLPCCHTQHCGYFLKNFCIQSPAENSILLLFDVYMEIVNTYVRILNVFCVCIIYVRTYVYT